MRRNGCALLFGENRMEYRKAKQRRRERGQLVSDDSEYSDNGDAGPTQPSLPIAMAALDHKHNLATLHGVALDVAPSLVSNDTAKLAADFKQRIVEVDTELSGLQSRRYLAHAMYWRNVTDVERTLRDLTEAKTLLCESHSPAILGAPLRTKKPLFRVMSNAVKSALRCMDGVLVKSWKVTQGHASITILAEENGLTCDEYEFHYNATLELVDAVHTELRNVRRFLEHTENRAVLSYNSVAEDMKLAIKSVRMVQQALDDGSSEWSLLEDNLVLAETLTRQIREVPSHNALSHALTGRREVFAVPFTPLTVDSVNAQPSNGPGLNTHGDPWEEIFSTDVTDTSAGAFGLYAPASAALITTDDNPHNSTQCSVSQGNDDEDGYHHDTSLAESQANEEDVGL